MEVGESSEDCGDGSISSPSLRDLVVSFYLQHNPEKVANVERILERYEGKDALLLAQLTEKYGQDPRKVQPYGKGTSIAPVTIAKGDAGCKMCASLKARIGAVERQCGMAQVRAKEQRVEKEKAQQMCQVMREQVGGHPPWLTSSERSPP